MNGASGKSKEDTGHIDESADGTLECGEDRQASGANSKARGFTISFF